MGMPYGTLVVLRANIKNPVNIVAFATGEKDQCRYFDVAEKKVFTINLSSTSFKVLTGIVPYFNSDPAYFDAQAEEGKEKFGLEPSLDRTIATELKKVSANGEKMRAEAERFDGLLSRDPSTQSFNASYLYDRVVENERLLDSLAARAQEISGVERMQLASVLETHKSLIETGLKCLEALERVEEAAGKTRVETEEIRKKMAYLRNESAKKMEEYTSKLKIPSE